MDSEKTIQPGGQRFGLPKAGKDGRQEFEGKFHVAIDHKQGEVTVDFGQNLSYLRMNPDQCDALANLMLKHAMAARIGI